MVDIGWMRRRVNTVVRFSETGTAEESFQLADDGGSLAAARFQGAHMVDDARVLVVGTQRNSEHSCVVTGVISMSDGTTQWVDVVPGLSAKDVVRVGGWLRILCEEDDSSGTSAVVRCDATTGVIDQNYGRPGPVLRLDGIDATSLAPTDTDSDEVYVVGSGLPDGESWHHTGLWETDPATGATRVIGEFPVPPRVFIGTRFVVNRACVLTRQQQRTALVASRWLEGASLPGTSGWPVVRPIVSLLHAYNLDEGGFPPRGWGWDGVAVDLVGTEENVADIRPHSGEPVLIVESKLKGTVDRTVGIEIPWTGLGCYRYDMAAAAARVTNATGEPNTPTTIAFRGTWDSVFASAVDSKGRSYVAGSGYTSGRPGELPGQPDIPAVTSPGLARWSTESRTGDDTWDETFDADFGSVGMFARNSRINALAIDPSDRPVVVLPTWQDA